MPEIFLTPQEFARAAEGGCLFHDVMLVDGRCPISGMEILEVTPGRVLTHWPGQGVMEWRVRLDGVQNTQPYVAPEVDRIMTADP